MFPPGCHPYKVTKLHPRTGKIDLQDFVPRAQTKPKIPRSPSASMFSHIIIPVVTFRSGKLQQSSTGRGEKRLRSAIGKP